MEVAEGAGRVGWATGQNGSGYLNAIFAQIFNIF